MEIWLIFQENLRKSLENLASLAFRKLLTVSKKVGCIFYNKCPVFNSIMLVYYTSLIAGSMTTSA